MEIISIFTIKDTTVESFYFSANMGFPYTAKWIQNTSEQSYYRMCITYRFENQGNEEE